MYTYIICNMISHLKPINLYVFDFSNIILCICVLIICLPFISSYNLFPKVFADFRYKRDIWIVWRGEGKWYVMLLQ